MAKVCVLCRHKYSAEDAQGISFHQFPKDKERKKKWLNAIGKDNVDMTTRLCSRHFTQKCFAGTNMSRNVLILTNDAVPTLHLEPVVLEIADESNAERKIENQNEEKKSKKQPCLPIRRPIIRRPRTRMLSDEEIQKMQPMKYVRYLKSVNWDEISKLPAEAKIAWEVAMEELKEGNDKIKHLQAYVCRLKTTVRKLEAALKARTKRAAVAAIAARHHKSLE